MRLREIIPLILILLLAAALRILFLNSVPGALGGDELHYILTIKSLALTGADLYGPWNIFSILAFNYPSGTPQAELSYFLLYPAVSLLPLSLFTSKITFALISTATVFAVYLLSKQLFDRRAGLIAAFICAVNPWQIYMGRTSYEVVPAVFFYILAIYFLIKEKSWRILISLPLFILAFYSYIGTKIVLVPIVICVSIFSYFANRKKFAKQYLVVNLICLVLVLFFALVTVGGNGRTGDLFTPSDPQISSIVDQSRKGSIAPNILDTILTNKITVFGKITVDKFLTIFSPSYLFISTDNFVGIYNHGLFLAIDFVFLILGLLLMFSRKRKAFGLFSILLVLSTLPQVFYKTRTDIFSPHLALFLIFLIVPIAYGISYLIERKRIIIGGIVVIIYLLSVINFLNIYFFQFPLVGHFDFGSRQMASYVARSSSNCHSELDSESHLEIPGQARNDGCNIDVYVQSPEDSYIKYIYYTNKLNSKNVSKIQNALQNKKYSIENVSFIDCSNASKLGKTIETIIIQRGACKKVELAPESLAISALSDGGELYAIYNDQVCSNFSLKPYPFGIKLSDFNVESLSNQKFCEAFVSK